jgi:sensor histidine kinase YesM
LLQCIIKKCNSDKKKEQKEWKAKLNHVLYSTSSTLNVYSIETIFCIFCVILTILLSAVRYFISREISSYWPRNI